MLAHAIRFSAHGGPEVLRWETVELPDPGPGEIAFATTRSVSASSTPIIAPGSTPSPCLRDSGKKVPAWSRPSAPA